MTQELVEYLVDSGIPYEDMGMGRFKVEEGICLEIESNSDNQVLDLREHPTLILDDYAQSQRDGGLIEFFVYQFGNRFYYTPTDTQEIEKLVPFEYIGEVEWGTPIPKGARAHMTVHGKYELMCGLGNYSRWAKKAKFLGYDMLGICDKNTLAGVIQFSQACHKNKLKPAIGVSKDFKYGKEILELKLYAATKTGWEGLMFINSQVRLQSIEELLPSLEGVVVLVSASLGVDEPLLNELSKHSLATYYHINTTEFEYELREVEKLDNIKWYIRQYKGGVRCIISRDTFCLEDTEEHLKSILIKQSDRKGTLTLKHSFISYDKTIADFYKHFQSDKKLFQSLVYQSGDSMKEIYGLINFEIDTKSTHLPAFKMLDEWVGIYGNNEELFKSLIGKGLSKIDFNKHSEKVVFDRIAVEGSLIKRGGFIDYFLILWDIVDWCKREGIEVGPGRGSSAGSLISYLIGITKINPLDFGLLFERFLNESRIKEGFPDIDIDFASDRREEVLEYMRLRYGETHVCQVGTYNSLKLKSALREINSYYKAIDTQEMNYISGIFTMYDVSFLHIFRLISTSSNRRLIQFVRDHYKMLHDAESIIGALKSTSIHACATIIVPAESGKTVSEQIPIRVQDGVLVSEWEGGELATAGYLKEDILSTIQMSKIRNTINLIEKHTGKKIVTAEIPLDDPKVYDLFCEGHNSDVFHFGSSGLTGYLKQVMPREIEDLIAAIALYRPGAMASGAHTDYVMLKSGEKEPEYDYMMEEITKNTYGLYIYQEQIMMAVQKLGGFDLTEADAVRSALGKMDQGKMENYQKQFLGGAIERGCSPEESKKIWDKLQAFSKYGFNKSHAAAYSVIGYICNWLKANYPFEFWISAFEFADEKIIGDYLSEVSKLGKIKVAPPEINKSTNHFEYDLELQTLYWDLSKIRMVGEKAVKAILIEREENGSFFSIDEFLYRMERFDVERHEGFANNPINKRVVENLIFAGAFDELHPFEHEYGRYQLMVRYYETRKDKLPEMFEANKTSLHYWPIQQYEVCKFSSLDYNSLMESVPEFQGDMKRYINGIDFNAKSKSTEAIIVGLIEGYEIRQTKKGQSFATVRLLHNAEILNVRIWPTELNSSDPRLQIRYFHRTTQEEVTGTLENALPLYQNKIVALRGKLELPDQYKSFNELVLSSHIDGTLIKFFD